MNLNGGWESKPWKPRNYIVGISLSFSINSSEGSEDIYTFQNTRSNHIIVSKSKTRKKNFLQLKKYWFLSQCLLFRGNRLTKGNLFSGQVLLALSASVRNPEVILEEGCGSWLTQEEHLHQRLRGQNESRDQLIVGWLYKMY